MPFLGSCQESEVNMKPWYSLGTLCIALLGHGCTPGAVQDLTLAPAPVEGESFLTVDQVVQYMDGLDPNSLDMEALGQIGMIGGREEDPFGAVFSLHEYPDLIYLDVWFYNRSDAAIELSPTSFTLVDALKSQFRYLPPHEAANLMLALRRNVPPYRPKRAYQVETYDYGSYTRSTVREVDANPFGALGHAIGGLITNSRNAKLLNAAAVIYAEGLVPGTSVAPDAGLRFGIQWLNAPAKRYPLELRIPELGYRISFNPPS